MKWNHLILCTFVALLVAGGVSAVEPAVTVEEPEATVQEGTVESVEEPQVPEVDLESLLAPPAESLACLDSGISCSSASQCVSVCYPYTCICNGTCQYCP